MVNLERGDAHCDVPLLGAQATAHASASADASASARFLWGNWRAFAARLRGLLEQRPWGLRSLRAGGPRQNPLPVEEYADEGVRLIRIELPGIDPDNDVEVSVRDRHLVIRATRREERASGANYRSEFHYGSFSRELPLPPGATEDDITADYQHGILQLRVPTREMTASAKRIPIGQPEG
jgi:HSP20 family protein